MTRSMTGFGKAERTEEGESITVELSSVNHRYLDCSLRLPNGWAALEPAIKETVKRYLSRGKVYLTVHRRGAERRGQPVVCDMTRAKEYVDASKELAQLVGAMEPLSLDTLASLQGVFVEQEAGEDLETTRERLEPVLTEALEQLGAMRATEGRALADDLRQRVHHIRATLETVEGRLPTLNAAYEERLRARIQELASDVSVTEERIAIEAAMLAEKGDVTEEAVRLKTHLDHMLELLDNDGPIGRRLDFLTQEVQRETNTLGVKTRDSEVTKDVLSMKAELEKIREQVQNIE